MKSRRMSKKLKVIVMPVIYIQPTTIHILQMFKIKSKNLQTTRIQQTTDLSPHPNKSFSGIAEYT